MRTKHPAYVTRRRGDSEWTMVARVRVWDPVARAMVMKRISQKVPEHACGSKTAAAEWARAMVKELRAEATREATLEFLAGQKRRQAGVMLREVFARLRDESTPLTCKTRAQERARWRALYRVAAVAKNLWLVAPGVDAESPAAPDDEDEESIKRPDGVKRGLGVVDEEAVEALPVSALNDMVGPYFQRSLGVEVLNWKARYENATSINSRLNQARACFRGVMAREKLRGLKLPDLSGFMAGQLVGEDGDPEPVPAEAFGRMVEAFDKLRDSRREMWLLNLVLRQTGLRSRSSAVQIHRTWLWDSKEGPWLNVGGKTRYQIPISEELAAEIRKSPDFLFYPDTPGGGQNVAPTEKVKALHAGWRLGLWEEQNALLKGIIGAGTGGQIAYRLRDTIASVTYHWLGIAVAQEALGHTDAKVTRKSYARRMVDRTPVIEREFSAWKRVAGAAEPVNVVPMVPAGKAVA